MAWPLLVLALVGPRLGAQVQNGSISGTVVDDRTGRAVPNAKVYAIRVAPRAFTTWTVQTGAGGTFALTPLTAGRYKVCAMGVAAYATNCVWVDGGDAVALASGQQLNGVVVRLKAGFRFRARVNDSRGLTKITAGGPRVSMLLGDGKGNFVPLNERKDASGGNFSMFVPVDTAMQLRVESSGVSLKDETGKTVVKGQPDISFQHTTADQAAGRTERLLTFEVAALGQ